MDTLNTPAFVEMTSSPLRMLNPKYIPSSHRASNFPGISLVSGIRKYTASPNSFIAMFDLRPLMSWYAVRPLGLTQLLVMTCPACRTSHGMTGWPMGIFSPTFISRAILKVLAIPSKLAILFSIVPFESESPTLELSIAVPNSLSRAFCTSRMTSTMDGSWSDLRISLSFFRPTVSRSSIT